MRRKVGSRAERRSVDLLAEDEDEFGKEGFGVERVGMTELFRASS